MSTHRRVYPGRLWRQLFHEPRECLIRFRRDILRGDLFDRAAQLAFWLLLGIFPGLMSLFVVFGSVVEERVHLRSDLLAYLDRVIPNEAVSELVRTVLEQIQENRGGAKFSVGILVTLWIGSTVLSQLHRMIDNFFDSHPRQTWYRRIAAYPFSLLVLLPIVSAVVLLFYSRLIGLALAARLGSETEFLALLSIGRWPVILLSILLSFDLVYNTAPSMLRRRSSWLTPGAVLALLLWLLVSLGFQRWVERFAAYSDFYGSLSVVILLMLWFFLTSIAVIAGIVLNTDIHQSIERAASPTEGLAGAST